MKIIETKFDGLVVLEPRVFHDDRGYFFESYNLNKLPEALKEIHFVQDNEAKSKRGALRGLHYQTADKTQSKFVRVIIGEVLDVVVDIRPQSKTYGQSFALILNDINKKMLFVPKGFAHGYVTLSDEAIFSYKCDEFYSPEHEAGINPLDAELKINWILNPNDFIISDKDKLLPNFGNHKAYEQ